MTDAANESGPAAVRPGIRILRGVSFVIPAGALRIAIGADGTPEMSITHFAAKVQMWPDWLEIALSRVADAKDARTRLKAASAASDDSAESGALAEEFQAAIQAISAGVFAVDAFYGVIADLVPVPEAIREARRRKRTGRATWVADTLGRATQMPNGTRRMMTEMLKQAYRLRDEAVHPPHRVDPYAVHPGLNQAVPRAYANYTLENAIGCVSWAAEAIMWVADHPRTRIVGLAEIAATTSTILHAIVDPHVTDDTDALWKAGAASSGTTRHSPAARRRS